MQNYILPLLLILITFNTLGLWLLGRPDLTDPLRFSSQLFALLGIVFMSLSLVLSTKIRILEKWLRGLDKMYFYHHLLGGIAFVLLVNHPLFLAVRALPSVDLAYMYLFPGSSLSYNLGIFGLYIMLLAFIFMVLIKLPYHIWLYTHKLLGLAFLLGSIHALTIGSDLAQNLPLKVWIFVFIVSGSVCSFYSIFLYKILAPKYLYMIKKIVKEIDVLHIYLAPVQKSIRFQPGQFAYFSFKDKAVSPELHPYSFSSSPKESLIRISVKLFGDHTLKLRDISLNSLVEIFGPYGVFGGELFSHTSDFDKVVMIAGGIGVTPFLSMLKSLDTFPTYFFYSYKSSEDSIADTEIKELTRTHSNLNYIPWNTQERGRLTSAVILKELSDIDNTLIYICGPQPMMESLRNGLIKEGIPSHRIIYENFSLI